jgi:hypothetical protein
MEAKKLPQKTVLEQSILRLKVQQIQQKLEIKNHLDETLQSLNPLNVLKQSVTEVKNSPDIQRKIFQAAISFTGGLLSKKLLVGNTDSTFKTILGYIIQFGVTKFIAKEVSPST